MNKLIVMLLCSVNVAWAFSPADEPFRTDANRLEQIEVTWRTVDDVQQACDRHSAQLGLGRMNFQLQACSFWDLRGGKPRCWIYTRRTATMHQLGHELRHCFQGDWHG